MRQGPYGYLSYVVLSRVEEETSLKTRLLTLDFDRKREEEENREKEDSAPEGIKKSFYTKLHSTYTQEVIYMKKKLQSNISFYYKQRNEIWENID